MGLYLYIATTIGLFIVAQTDGKWNGNGSQKAFRKWLNNHLGELYYLADLHHAEEIREKLHFLVPEYQVQHNSCVLDVPHRESSTPKIMRSGANKQKFEYPGNSKRAALSTM